MEGRTQTPRGHSLSLLLYETLHVPIILFDPSTTHAKGSVFPIFHSRTFDPDRSEIETQIPPFLPETPTQSLDFTTRNAKGFFIHSGLKLVHMPHTIWGGNAEQENLLELSRNSECPGGEQRYWELVDPSDCIKGRMFLKLSNRPIYPASPRTWSLVSLHLTTPLPSQVNPGHVLLYLQ